MHALFRKTRVAAGNCWFPFIDRDADGATTAPRLILHPAAMFGCGSVTLASLFLPFRVKTERPPSHVPCRGTNAEPDQGEKGEGDFARRVLRCSCRGVDEPGEQQVQNIKQLTNQQDHLPQVVSPAQQFSTLFWE